MYHRQSRMTQDSLQAEHVPAASQKFYGEGMPESVRVAVRHPSLCPQVHQQVADAVVIHPPAVLGQEQWVIPLYFLPLYSV